MNEIDTMTTATLASEAEPQAISWESRISELLATLSEVQGDLLSMLEEKRLALAAGEYDKLNDFTHREAILVQRLEACHANRQALLVAAAEQGLPSESVQSLTQALPASERASLDSEVHESRKRSRLLQHHSLTNWVVVQRTLIHLSQMIEIIATGGRMKPTYGKSDSDFDSGSLVDRHA